MPKIEFNIIEIESNLLENNEIASIELWAILMISCYLRELKYNFNEHATQR